MSTHSLRVTGPALETCVLGGPMLVHYGDQHLGTVDPVPVSRGGTEIRIEHFTPSRTEAAQRLHGLKIGRIILLELVAFIAERFSTVTLVRLCLHRDIESYREGITLAAERSELLQAMGASHIVITPKPDAGRIGHFVVAAAWEYNQANLAALGAALESERTAYGERERLAAARSRRKRCWLFPRRPPSVRRP